MATDLPVPATIQQIEEFPDINWEIEFLRFSADGHHIAATTMSGPIQMWDIHTSEKQIVAPLARKERISSLQVIDDICIATSFIPLSGFRIKQGQRFPLDADGIVYVRRNNQAPTIYLAHHESAPSGAQCSRSGDLIVTSDIAWTIRLWNARDGQLISSRIWEGGVQSERSRNDRFAFSPDDHLLALCCDAQRRVLQIWGIDPVTQEMLPVTELHDVPYISLLMITDDGQQLIAAVGGFPATALHIYALPNLALVERIPLPPQKSDQLKILSFAISLRHACIALMLEDAQVWIWHRPSQQYVLSFQSHPLVPLMHSLYWNARVVAWSPDGEYLATGGFLPDASHVPEGMFSVRLWQVE